MARKAGQIIKRDDRKFVVRIYRGTDAKGRRKYRNQTVNGTKADAQKVLNKLLREKDKGTLLEPNRMTLGDFLDQWLDTAVKPRVRQGTYNEYTATLRRCIREPLGDTPLPKITPVAIQGVYSDMHDADLTASVQYTHTVLRMALAQAVKWRMIPSNPADAVDVPRRKRERAMRALTCEEANRFLAAAASTDWTALFELLLSTGLRPSEAFGLKWEDLDLAGESLVVRRRLRWVAGSWDVDAPKTDASRRSAPIPYGLARSLAAHHGRMNEIGLPDLVFCGIDGQPVHQRAIVKGAFKPALAAARLPKSVRLYDLRHTHATLLLLADVHPKVVAERLGHASVRITLDTYSHVLPSMQQEAASKLDMLLYSGSSKGPADAAN